MVGVYLIVEVQHVFVFIANLTAEILPYNALPCWMELLVKFSLKDFCQVHVCLGIHLKVLVKVFAFVFEFVKF